LSDIQNSADKIGQPNLITLTLEHALSWPRKSGDFVGR